MSVKGLDNKGTEEWVVVSHLE